MKQVRVLRIILAIVFLLASAAALIVGSQTNALTRIAERSQIILSALSITAGTTLMWLLLSLLFGRIYCSTVCPVGTLSDIVAKCRRFIPKRYRKPYRYRHTSRASVHILWIYIVCLLVGIVGVPFLIEPWNIARNLTAGVNPDAVRLTWSTIGISALTGFIAGCVTFLAIALLSLFRGREFCTAYCPLGIGLGYLSAYSFYHIDIDRDKCTSCGLCEDICRAQCIKVVSRYVDNSRCVRCFDCVAKCPDDAIRFQINRNRPATPLMMRSKKRSNT